MEGTNEQSSIRIEDFTVYPYCMRLKRKPKAKMKLQNYSNTMCINGEENRDTDAMQTNFGHLRDEGRIDDEAMNEEDTNTEDQRFKCPCER